MKFVISCNGVKRQINGAFSICGSREDFEIMQYFIEQGLHGNMSHGWIDIYDQTIKVIPNESPYDWWQEAK